MMRKFLKVVGLFGTAVVLGFGPLTAQQTNFTAAVAAPPCGQDVKAPALDKLAARAREANDISLDPNMLQMAAKFMANSSDDAEMKQTVNGLKSIYVRTFEFDKPGEYSPTDYEEFRKQLQDPAWARILNSKEKDGEATEIYVRRQGDKLCGIALIDAEPKELTIVSINGEISPDTLSNLKKLGVPVPNVKVELF
jgi:hypothetical protein